MSERKVGIRGKRRIQVGFMRPVKPDAKLSAIIGCEPLPRSELTKRLWNYIRKHGLQDVQKKGIINADENLKPVFNGKQQVTMFEMSKLVFSHTVQE